ncbi:hypothetical protein T492DRAFT_612581 [Pavlovales sp. CCMP2436]|nr:hypothetical protein T492DRAFT_612581 [Pavlovales sp. CCMP2436]
MSRTVRLLVVLVFLAALGGTHAKSLYDTLGLRKGEASDVDVKRAYRRMALKHHPDRHPKADAKLANEKKFKEVSTAYEVLGDPEKRRVYDQFGEQGIKAQEAGADFSNARAGGGSSFGGTSPFGGGTSPFGGVRFSFGQGAGGGLDEIFSAFFGQGGGGQFGGAGARRGAPPAATTRSAAGTKGAATAGPVEVRCTLVQLYAGCSKSLKVSRGGRSAVVEFNIAPGTRPGTLLRTAATASPGVAQGMRFVLRLAAHPWLSWEGDNLLWRCVLTRAQAKNRKGVKLRIPCLDGRELLVSTKGLRVREGSRHVLRGEGMPLAAPQGTGAGRRGDLIIVFSVSR